MSNMKSRALMGASALVMAGVAAASASAQTATVYGGGSTLSAPYVRQMEDCFGAQAPLFTPGKAAQNSPAEIYTGVDCSVASGKVDPATTMYLEASGSGAGVLAYFDHLGSKLGSYTAVDGTTGHTFPLEHYATSDTPLGAASVAVYNNGGDYDPATGKLVAVVAPGVTPGTETVSVDVNGNPLATPLTNVQTYANPKATFGAMVQVPVLITPITVAFSPVYKKVLDATDGVTVRSYKLNISATANKGVLRLARATYCKIFDGQITNWNDPEIAATNGLLVSTTHPKTATTAAFKTAAYTPLVDPTDPDAANWSTTGLPIELVGRADGSGTTSLFSRALAAQCPGAVSPLRHDTDATGAALPTFAAVTVDGGGNYAFADSVANIPSALSGPAAGGAPVSGKFTLASGSGGVATYLKFTAVPTVTGVAGQVTTGKITYLSPDYVTVPTAPAGVGNSTYGLTTAALANHTGASYILPLASKALAAFGALTPPTGADVTDASKWVQAPSKTAALADPTALTGYPITGTTQVIAYSCYKDDAVNSASNIGYKMNRFFFWYLKNPIVNSVTAGNLGILESFGFAPMPAAWRTAAYNAFVVPSSASVVSTTYISPKSDISTINPTTNKPTISFRHNTACDAAGVTGA